MSKPIVIHCGHGGLKNGIIDVGAVDNLDNPTRYERDDNLVAGHSLRKHLESQGLEVFMPRRSNEDVKTSQQCVAEANAKGGEAFISLHRNAWTDPDSKGYETFVEPNSYTKEMNMVKAIHSAVVGVGVSKDRGVKTGTYDVCTLPQMPSCLVELGFITNAEDNRLFDTKVDEYMKAIAKAICEWLGLTWVEPADSSGAIGELEAQVKALEADKANLQAACDEKDEQIDTLSRESVSKDTLISRLQSDLDFAESKIAAAISTLSE